MSEIIDKFSSVLLIYRKSQSILLKKLLLRDKIVISPRNDQELEQIEGAPGSGEIFSLLFAKYYWYLADFHMDDASVYILLKSITEFEIQ